ncbi:MAG: phosphoglycolate phosphatase, partial [Caulobacterales bacterium]
RLTGSLADATIVFDLDGTLVDTAPDLLRALNETLDLEGLPHPPLGQVKKMVGQGARALIERAATLAGARFLPERLDQLTNAFIGFYRADIASKSSVYAGVPEALTALAEAGAKLAVCTNKRTDLSVQLLEEVKLAHRFSAIVGADSVQDRKPHPDHFRAAVSRAGGSIRRAIMIGDSAADVATAKGAGAPVIVVRFGYADLAPEKLGADALINRYDELPRLALSMLAA